MTEAVYTNIYKKPLEFSGASNVLNVDVYHPGTWYIQVDIFSKIVLFLHCYYLKPLRHRFGGVKKTELSKNGFFFYWVGFCFLKRLLMKEMQSLFLKTKAKYALQQKFQQWQV